jgi:hypothetical protein
MRQLFLHTAVSVFLLTHGAVFAQRDNNANLSVGLGGGVMFYNGDLSDSDPIPDGKLINPYLAGEVSWLLVDRMDMSLGLLYGSVEAADSLTNERDNQARNLSFTSKYIEMNLQFRLSLLSVKNTFPVNPFLMGGIGAFYFNPKAEYEGVEYELQPLGTEGQFIPGGQYEDPYKRVAGTLNGGGGVHIRVNENWRVRLEGAAHITFTDYLDDVSTIFPDSADLSRTPNGSIAVLLSSKRPKGWPKAGRSRGNSGNDDVVFRFGFSVIYIFPAKTNRPKPKPGILSNPNPGNGGWWGNTRN